LKKTLRYTLRIAVAVLSLFLLAWLVLGGYILLNKASLLKKVRSELNKQIAGEALIGNMDISLFHEFPSLALHLSKVELRDSLWQHHHHDLLSADHVFIRLSLRGLLSGQARAGQVSLEQGTVYLFTDSMGYSNKSLFRTGDKGSGQKEVQPPDISLKDIRLVMDDQSRNKKFDLQVRHLSCVLEKDKKKLSLQINTSMRVGNFSFNTEKGSFIKDKELSGRFTLQFNTASGILQFNKVVLTLDGHPFLFSGRFFPNVRPDPFLLTIQATDVPFRKATALLTPGLKEKLEQYAVDKNVSLDVSLDAGSADDHTPRIIAKMNLSNATVTTPAGRFSAASFNAAFTNEWVNGHKREDENSGIRLLSFRGIWENIPISADTINIIDLKHPVLFCDLHSRFGLERLNDLSGSRTIQFQKGGCAVDLFYKGPLSENDSVTASINGTMDIDSAAVEYLPHRLRLTNCRASIHFKDQDVLIDKLEAHAGSSMIFMKGIARKAVSLIDKNPGDQRMDWTVSSPRLDLRDLSSVLGSPAGPAPVTVAKKSTEHPFGAATARVDRLLRDGSAHVRLEASNISYGKFSGAHAKADLLFTGDEVKLNSMQVEQGSGSLAMSGSLRRNRGSAGNPVTLQSHIGQADLPGIFASFNNFGQQAIREKNLKGKLTADIRMTGLLTDKATMVNNSLKGTVNFTISNGQLLDFEPMEKISENVLKKRDLSEIHFAELKNQLDVDSTTIVIHRMEIQSTAFTIFAEGVYDLKKGADMSLQIPLSNLKAKKQDVAPTNKGKAGISLRLRARTGDDGKLKITWDPFRKGPGASSPKARKKEKNNNP